ncbi:DUF2634 domain-containing protein [Aneurinibacillus aneurinilyticus]|uniref:Phage protein XkdS domain protein n=1 Tax=Aneurinibacillus aneurinilyticus ATCC 12856 TaxID=649747 RepID=U1XYS6_ANEAE|nr:DUF2634 domain-containing protein [Aneurinibacillus aneurinilyticus]ERI05152.1 hypothetical protein HMPREF0083_05725 [Aneurinibacillus aneurinilyticus ATCC 12856]MED0708186.1 DUF2634 domain-containing protein [Aneurinibacillus aneurinilyticus]MED0721461.1 DUF2634 domain-containing protein [Aneurinibacillus aneurinilyticus]MED0734071.1 DUF2634 domain-containing protein [Aneurinibacillus aneurinilyticus]MED0743198.1 DUF2634 domain-containing protein [Aneurinibacillus aneurinilyticus]
MTDEPISLFPEMNLIDMEETEIYEGAASNEKWTYMLDFRNRCAVVDEDGRARKTKTYAEFLIQTAMKILNTERFQYVVYSEDIGVEKSEWPGWEDVEIKRDMEEALTAHPEIQRAEVLSIERDAHEVYVRIHLVGLAGTAEVEEAIRL